MRYFIVGLLLMASSKLFAHPSWSIQIDSKGNIYFADIANNGRGSLWKFTKAGELQLLATDFHAHNVSLDEKGHPVSANGEGLHCMIRFTPEGRDTLVKSYNINHFFGGNATYTSRGEVLFNIDHTLWTIDANGEKKRFHPHHLEWSQCLFVDSEGEVYAPEIGYGLGKVYHLRRNGEAVLIADSLISKTPERNYDKHNDVLLGMAKDSEGCIYVCETAGKQIIKIHPGGNKESYYVSNSDWMPTALQFHGEYTYILEYNVEGGVFGPRVVCLSSSGDRRVLVNVNTYKRKIKHVRSGVSVFWWIFLIPAISILLTLRYNWRCGGIPSR